MLKQRLIPCLLLSKGRCVKTVSFGEPKDTGNPVTAARVYDHQRADELIFLDISASSEHRATLLTIIEQVGEECFMPLTVGGGIRTVEEIRQLLKIGADKVSINTAAMENPELIGEAARRFGSQCVVINIDVRKDAQGTYRAYTHGGTRAAEKDPFAWAEEAVRRGAGELLIQSIDRDGTMQGYDLGLLEEMARRVDVPVIALGGAGTLEHFADGLRTGVSAVSGASLFHFTDQNPIKVRAYLKNEGFNVRAVQERGVPT